VWPERSLFFSSTIDSIDEPTKSVVQGGPSTGTSALFDSVRLDAMLIPEPGRRGQARDRPEKRLCGPGGTELPE